MDLRADKDIEMVIIPRRIVPINSFKFIMGLHAHKGVLIFERER